MSNHTSGPWHVNAVLNGKIVGDETAKEFASLQVCGSNCTVATVYHRSDARLIAAAPDLLAALQRIEDGAVMYGRENWTHAETVCEYQKIAREAIAKASK
jgi:hypothetical protein